MPMLVLTNTPIYAATLQSCSFRRPFFVARIGTLGEAWAIIFRRVLIWCLSQSLHNLRLYRVFHVFTGSTLALGRTRRTTNAKSWFEKYVTFPVKIGVRSALAFGFIEPKIRD